MCVRHQRAESQRHCGQPSDTMRGMIHDLSAMNHPSIEGMSAALASQSCQTNCATVERLAVSRKAVPQVMPVQSDAVTVETTVKFLVADSATSRFVDGSPPEPLSAYASSCRILRI